jgi:hypothetical protein
VRNATVEAGVLGFSEVDALKGLRAGVPDNCGEGVERGCRRARKRESRVRSAAASPAASANLTRSPERPATLPPKATDGERTPIASMKLLAVSAGAHPLPRLEHQAKAA